MTVVNIVVVNINGVMPGFKLDASEIYEFLSMISKVGSCIRKVYHNQLVGIANFKHCCLFIIVRIRYIVV